MELKFEVPIIDTLEQYEEIEVMLEGQVEWVDDSFSYSGSHCTGGVGGIHHVPLYTAMESDVEWDKTLFNAEQNIIIQNWVNTHTSLIEERFCKQLEKDSEPDF